MIIIFYFKGGSIDLITINICFYYMISYYKRNNFINLCKVIVNLMENLLFLRIFSSINLMKPITQI